MKIYRSVTELIGATPLLKISNFAKNTGAYANILAKLECFNPAGSAKDRIAREIIETAEAEGKLKQGSVIIEPTSGNTGIGLAAIAASKGYRTIIVMPETMSDERKKLIKTYGAQLVLTEGKKGMAGAVEKAEEIANKTPGSFIAGQFINPANPAAHRKTTGPEIWNDTDGNVDIVVCGVGTGGTITGVGEYLKDKNPDIKIVAVEPHSSPLLSSGIVGPHKIQGIGANFVPEVMNKCIYDEVITVKDDEAYAAARLLVQSEGILCGISSGAALHAASRLASRQENKGKNIVVILPDTGERYLSTEMFD